MNPTCEQLDNWAAEALKKKVYRIQADLGLFYDGEKHVSGLRWFPSRDLSQARREFVPVLRSKSWAVEIYTEWHNDIVTATLKHPKFGLIDVKGELPYAFTYAFVQALEPQGYLDWKTENA